ncbi:sulfotransferase [Glycomyces sp. L485]|uniref:sulfotransferase family protein n=1 Tax=Glycomyces sp. L485 TaxID=2909235 RepID=UPI001F4A44C3|nr:sulfotransferase [Glycomyces sp. L485]MCH7230433.1 sulfotransferase [Glycomyces sp. L485]
MRRISTTARALNLLLTPAARARKSPEKAWAKIVAKAEAEVGADFGDDQAFVDDLGYVFHRFAEIPGLTGLGWSSTASDFQSRLTNRLRIRHRHAERPEIGAEPIERPVFIVGLPRTATTLTHRILANSREHRGPLLWEMLHTDVETDAKLRDRRIRDVEKRVAAVPKLSPALNVMHPINARGPEESLFLLPHTHYHLARAPLAGYREWLDERDLTEDYRYLKQALQVLQYGRERRRWILKTPMDLFHLPVIHKVFPDATIIWTHRDPTTVIGSCCSMTETMWALSVKQVDRAAVGEFCLGLLAESVERGRDARAQLPAGTIVDVPYHVLSSDPHRYVPDLYEQLGAKWTDEDADNLAGVLARPATDRKHEYDLADYGLTSNDVEAAFGDYPQLVNRINTWRAGSRLKPRNRAPASSTNLTSRAELPYEKAM